MQNRPFPFGTLVASIAAVTSWPAADPDVIARRDAETATPATAQSIACT
jgi:hypothetical protein